jgi:hypothetical protein
MGILKKNKEIEIKKDDEDVVDEAMVEAAEQEVDEEEDDVIGREFDLEVKFTLRVNAKSMGDAVQNLESDLSEIFEMRCINKIQIEEVKTLIL